MSVIYDNHILTLLEFYFWGSSFSWFSVLASSFSGSSVLASSFSGSSVLASSFSSGSSVLASCFLGSSAFLGFAFCFVLFLVLVSLLRLRPPYLMDSMHDDVLVSVGCVWLFFPSEELLTLEVLKF